MTAPHLSQDELFPSSHTNEPCPVRCSVCDNAEPFDGWNECLKCGTAALLQDDPDYIYTARKLYAGSHWLGVLEAEWERQASALLSAGLMITTPVQGFSEETMAWLKGLAVTDETV